LRRLAEEVIARAPFRQDIKEPVGIGNSDTATNIAPATEISVGNQTNGGTSNDREQDLSIL
jgi:hypothetical protein